MIAMYGKWWFETCISSYNYQNLIILVSPDLQFSNLNKHPYSSLKSADTCRPINLYIILFENHFPFQKSVFCHSKYTLGDVLDNYVQKYEKRFIFFLQKKNKKKKKKKKKRIFALECVYSF